MILHRMAKSEVERGKKRLLLGPIYKFEVFELRLLLMSTFTIYSCVFVNGDESLVLCNHFEEMVQNK